MIAHCADHAWLRVVEDHVVRKTADVQFGVMMTARIAATDEHSVSTMVHGIAYQRRPRRIGNSRKFVDQGNKK
jgi:hypothetical protein